MNSKFVLLSGLPVLGAALLPAVARADDYVYGASSGIASMNQLVLSLAGGSTVTVPLVTNPTNTALPIFESSAAGWYSNQGFGSGVGNDDYVTGLFQGMLLRSYGVYDLSEASGPITSPVVAAFNQVATFGVLTNGSENVDLWDVTTPASTLISYPIDGAEMAIYDDLGSGKLYGTENYVAADSNGSKTIPLSPDFVADVNTVLANGLTNSNQVLGGDLTISIGYEDTTAIPEPATMSLMAIGAAGMLGRRRERRNAA